MKQRLKHVNVLLFDINSVKFIDGSTFMSAESEIQPKYSYWLTLI